MSPLVLLLASLAVSAAAQEPADARIKSLEDRLNKLEGASAKTHAAHAPEIGVALDAAYRHANGRSNFDFRAVELEITAPLDPFVKAWTVIVGSRGGVAIEEGAMQTTSLPYGLTVTGGRMFASFGRLARSHTHTLPVIDRPRSIDSFIGGETQADGMEVSYLFSTPFSLIATGGAFNKIGGENARVSNAGARTMDNFTYLGRLEANADIADDHRVEFGVSEAWTPKRFVAETTVPGNTTRKNTWRSLAGADLAYRWRPSAGGPFKELVWAAEVMQNNERRFDAATSLPTDRVRSHAGLTYAQIKVGRKWRPGVMLDLTEDLDAARTLTRTLTGFITYDATEFQRLRLTFARTTDNRPTGRANNTVGLQWTGVIGEHQHRFEDL